MECNGPKPSFKAIAEPPINPTAQPDSKAGARNQPLYRPKTTLGKVCRIHRPPSNCRSSANCVGRKIIQSNAPTLTTREVIFATLASPAGETEGSTYAFQKFRVKRFAAPIDMTDAGTKAPIATAANAEPANQPGNNALKSAGTVSLGLAGFMPAA